MSKETMTLQPGLLVSLKSSLDGGVSYTRVDIASTEGGDGVSKVEEWTTTKVVMDPEEHKAAAAVRNGARAMIAKVCMPSTFGPICVTAREKELDAAVVEARETVRKFNETARTCRVGIYVMKGRIAENDEEAARGIADELRELMDEMRDGIGEIDVKKIRDAASRAKKMGAMLDVKAAGKLSAAIEEAREIAKQIVKKATEKGADVSKFVSTVEMKAIEGARFSFLDLDMPEVVNTTALPSVAARSLDTDDEESDGTEVVTKMLKRDESEIKAASPMDGRVLDV